jgi:hypothetical protein
VYVVPRTNRLHDDLAVSDDSEEEDYGTGDDPMAF